jgi:hypothetical protein
MDDELTPWFDGRVVPARPGVYIRELGIRGADYAYWTGKKWWAARSTPAYAACARCNSGFQISLMRWRGLASPSKQTKEG